MNTIDDTIATLLPDAQKLLHLIMKASAEMFAQDQQLQPCAFAVNAGGHIEALQVPELSDNTKPAVWAFVGFLRRTHPIVAFISEVWLAHCGPEEVKDGKVKVRPRDRPDRSEQSMITLWQGDRHVALLADIKRQPDHLEPYRVMFDSAFPQDKITSLGGAMMDGQSYPLNLN